MNTTKASANARYPNVQCEHTHCFTLHLSRPAPRLLKWKCHQGRCPRDRRTRSDPLASLRCVRSCFVKHFFSLTPAHFVLHSLLLPCVPHGHIHHHTHKHPHIHTPGVSFYSIDTGISRGKPGVVRPTFCPLRTPHDFVYFGPFFFFLFS